MSTVQNLLNIKYIIYYIYNIKYIIIKVKLLIFSVDPLSHEICFTVGVCYIAKIQYNILRLDKVLKIS
jgi:hypothetical protein